MKRRVPGDTNPGEGDENGNGGSEGNGGVSWNHWNLKRRLIKPFETEFIIKLDSTLKLKHTNPD